MHWASFSCNLQITYNFCAAHQVHIPFMKYSTRTKEESAHTFFTFSGTRSHVVVTASPTKQLKLFARKRGPALSLTHTHFTHYIARSRCCVYVCPTSHTHTRTTTASLYGGGPTKATATKGRHTHKGLKRKPPSSVRPSVRHAERERESARVCVCVFGASPPSLSLLPSFSAIPFYPFYCQRQKKEEQPQQQLCVLELSWRI